MLAYLRDGLWLENARTANGLAAQLAEGLGKFRKIRIPNPVQANEVFAVIPRTLNEKLLASGAKLYDWMPDSLDDGIADDEIFVRFVLSYATPEADVRKFLGLVKELHA
jgi:threonine aldolase